MATIQNSTISVGLSNYDLLKASRKYQIDTLNGAKYLKMLRSYGVINYEEKLSGESGTSVIMYNAARISGMGAVGDIDQYANSISLQTANRTLSIRKHSLTVNYAMKKSERQQIAEFDLKANAPKLVTQWGQELLLYQCMNQLTTNTATTISAAGVFDDATLTASGDLSIIRGHNTPGALSTTFRGWGSQAAGSVTADESVNSANPLILQDFMTARETIMATTLGIPRFNTLKSPIDGMNVDLVALVSTTGMNQLKRDPTTVGQGLNVPQLIYAELAGGGRLQMPGNAFFIEGIAFVELPDNYFSRGVNSSTAASVANTRRAVLLGANAVDFALGKGYGAAGATVPGFSIETDENYKPLNKQGYLSASINGGFKKVQLFGTGANASTAYDNAIFTLTHYSRT